MNLHPAFPVAETAPPETMAHAESVKASGGVKVLGFLDA